MKNLKPLQIDSFSRVPPYQQIVEWLRRAILADQLKGGSPLPPIRELAKILRVNPNTVARAYNELKEAGVIESRPGSGNIVKTGASTRLDPIREQLIRQAFDEFLQLAAGLGADRETLVNLFKEFNHE